MQILWILLSVFVIACGSSSKPKQESGGLTEKDNAEIRDILQGAESEQETTETSTAERSDTSAGRCSKGLDYFRGCMDTKPKDKKECLTNSQIFLQALLASTGQPADTNTETSRKFRAFCNGLCEGKRVSPTVTFEELCLAVEDINPDVLKALPRI
jgi:hypothetical protein